MRRMAAFAALLVTVLVGIEIGARALLAVTGGRDEISARVIEATMLRSEAGPSLPGAAQALEPEEVIHPYLGYVVRPSGEARAAGLSLDALGFPGGGAFVTEADPGRLVVGVFGGSVAQNFANAGGPARMLRGYAGDREIVVANLGLGGYKQPQALLSFAYLLSLGMHFDVVLLLDGFNEAVLPVVENVNQGAFPFFPRLWAWRVASLDVATDVRSLIGEIAFRRDLRRSIARSFQDSSLSQSGFVSLLWMLADRRMSAAIEQRRHAVQELRPKSLDYLASGPAWPRAGREIYGDLAAVWARSSMQMQAMSRDAGILYAHFLQPNQYVADTKPFSDEEKAHFVVDAHPYRNPVGRGYEEMRIAGDRLIAAGVAFHSLVDVFAETPETVYADDCCHLNQRGNDLLADAMARAIGLPADAPPRVP